VENQQSVPANTSVEDDNRNTKHIGIISSMGNIPQFFYRYVVGFCLTDVILASLMLEVCKLRTKNLIQSIPHG